MNIQNLLNQFIGTGDNTSSAGNAAQGIGDTLSKLGDKLPGGLAGGAAAGGIMALLVGNKSARKFAGKAAGYGGAAVLGGLAYKAYSNWQHNKEGTQNTVWSDAEDTKLEQSESFTPIDEQAPDFQLQLIKSMIAAAKADGHIDASEQQRIFDAVEEMELSTEVKGVIFDLLQQSVTVEELATGMESIEQKSEVYLAACLVIDPDHPSEQAHLEQLEAALKLPEGLAPQLQWQAQRAMAGAA
jgi:uncharacterized membrane protein YebE (DUF533 family)